MRVVVYPAMMEIGGSQTNAIELAETMSRRGHEVVVFGPSGVLVDRVRDMGLEFAQSPVEHSWPSLGNVRALTELVRSRGIDLVHAYEWGPAADSTLGPHARLGTPVVVTVYSMSVPRFVVTHVPLIVGTADLHLQESAIRPVVHLLEPPIDTGHNAPTGSPSTARARFGIRPDDVVIGVVGRIVPELGKLSGILEAIEAVDLLRARLPVRLLVVGDGPGLLEVSERAAAVNRAHGQDVVILTGGLLDPRDAYEATDIALGMGSSALKSLAFSKPLVVQGEHGFWRLLDEDSLDSFLSTGWHGHGGRGVADLLDALGPVLVDPERRSRLGGFGRRTVTERFGLEHATTEVAGLYRQALASRSGRLESWRGTASMTYELAKFKFSLMRQGWSAGRRAEPAA